MNPIVSVLMTSYNREKYIAEAIESLLASTFKAFELIIVDDCSKDNTVQIAKSYAEKDSRIRLYVNESNLGQFGNRNKAASYATGDYVKYLDSDDYIFPESLQKMVNAMLLFPSAVWGSERVDGTLGVSKYQNATLPFSLNTTSAFSEHYKGGGVLFTGPTSTIYKRSAFLEVNGFDVTLGINADVDLNLKLAAVGDVVIIDRNLTHWRKHDEQIDTQQSDKLKMLKEKYIINFINISNTHLSIPTSLKKEIILMQKIFYARNLLKFMVMYRKPSLLFSYTSRNTIKFYELIYFMIPLKFVKFLS